MAIVDVDVIGLIECLVSPDWRLSFGSAEAPAIHYNPSGTGRMVVGGFSAFPLVPHTLVITPAKKPFHIEVDDRTAAKSQRPAGWNAGDDDRHPPSRCSSRSSVAVSIRPAFGSNASLF
jgi:hypothetical protein